LLDQSVEPDLLATQHGDELRVFELPAEEAVAQDLGPEAVAQLEPVALLGGREVGELELHLALEVRVLELGLLVASDSREARGDVANAVEAGEDVLALDLELVEHALPVGGERPQALVGQEWWRVAPVVPRAADLVAERRAQGDAAGERFCVLHVVEEGSGRWLQLHIDHLLPWLREAGLRDLFEVEIERHA